VGQKWAHRKSGAGRKVHRHGNSAGVVESPATPPTGEAPPPSRRRKWLYAVLIAVVAIVVVVGIVLAVVLSPGASSPQKVTATATTISFDPSDSHCFGAGFTNSTPVTLTVGGQETISVPLMAPTNGLVRACTVTGVSVNTTGFSVVSSNTPLLVDTSGITTLQIVVGYPTSSYSGPLNLTASLSFILPNVTVQKLNFSWSPASNPCGLDAPVAISPSFTAFAGGNFTDNAGFASFDASSSCTLNQVTTNTTGFSIITASVPYSIPSDNFGGISYELQMPSVAFNGTLYLTLHLTW
jgi:hypothetical protein